MKKKHKNIIAIFIAAAVISYLYYVVITVPIRPDRTLINDLSKTNKILVTLSRYDFITFVIEARNLNRNLESNCLELVVRKPNGETLFSTQKYKISYDSYYKDSVYFKPYFYSAPEASPPIRGERVMAVFLKPEVPFELEIKYQGKDNKNVLQGASLEMVASSKIKYGYSDKHFSVKLIDDK